MKTPARGVRPDAAGTSASDLAKRAHPDFSDREPIRYLRPELPSLDEVARYYALAEDARFYSNGGPCHQRLARRLAEYVGGEAWCVPVANCTLGLIAALHEVCGPAAGARKLIAVPSFTFTATACAIRWAGYEPLFVDVQADSWQLDPAALEQAIERHEGAIAGVMGCSTFGTAAPSSVRAAWREVCGRRHLPLLLDSAAGFGALDEFGRPLGSQGDTEIFSFHATKPFAIGEGGAIFTSDPELAERLGRLINFGLDPDTRATAVPGLNAKMSELHAATGLAMLDRFEDALGRRRATAERLRESVAHLPIQYQWGADGSTWQIFQLLVPDGRARQRAQELAAARAIEVRTCFDPPLHRHPAFASAPVAGSLEVTEALAARALSLPMANTLGPRQTARMVGLLDATLGDRC